MSAKSPDLHAAYALKTPDDSRRLYADWAKSYDSDFVAGSDYQLHQHAARAFVAAGGSGPVLDVGAGTGACGLALAEQGAGPIDATDISAEMLEQARAKGVYRHLFEADLTEGPPTRDHTYNGIVSSGTFTTGHVGPDAIDNLLPIARSGAVFSLSVNRLHYESAGFAGKFRALEGQITAPDLIEVAIYGPAATGPNKDDRAFLAVFRKL
jgi:predicted TPR repeat methyltransferase